MAKARNSNEKIDRVAAIAALVILTLAAIIGFMGKMESQEKQIQEAYPEALPLERLSNNLFSYPIPDSEDKSYIVIGQGKGYGGELSMAVKVGTDLKIKNVLCLNHRETPSFMDRIDRRKFTNDFNNILVDDQPENVRWPDAISGATYTTEAITKAVQSATGDLRENLLGFSNWVPEREPFKWTVRYAILILVFVIAYLMLFKWFPLKKQFRWVFLIFNMVFFGFWLGNQLSISQVSRLLIGDFPSLYSHLFFYLLLAGTLIFILLLNKNIYCDRICPFGAAQQCVNAISGTKKHPTKNNRYLVWIQRIIVLSVLVASLLLQNPTRFNYEVFSAFFQLIGTILHFSLLIIFLLGSLFLIRPWCNLLCPIKPVTDFVKMMRGWVVRSS